jgi:hypothetical protein
LRKNFFTAFFVPPALDQNIQYLAILINCTPQVNASIDQVNASIDLEEHFIKMPSVASPRRSSSQVVGISLPEFEAAFSNGFVSEDNTAHRNISSISLKLKAKRKYS